MISLKSSSLQILFTSCEHKFPTGLCSIKGIYLYWKGDIICQLFPGAPGILEALDVQQQHPRQAVEAQPLGGLRLVIARLTLEALVILHNRSKESKSVTSDRLTVSVHQAVRVSEQSGSSKPLDITADLLARFGNVMPACCKALVQPMPVDCKVML